MKQSVLYSLMNGGKLNACLKEMAAARTYEDWLEAASEHDKLSGADDWKSETESEDYDYHLIESRLKTLRRFRRQKDIPRLVFFLREELHGNLGNMANPALYSYSMVGTKHLIRDYVQEVADTLDYLCEADLKQLPAEKKLEFFKRAAQSFGRTSLLLSGGATLGIFHLGVIKELWRQHLLPRVISGSSAGSLVTALVGTHTDEQLHQIFEPGYLDIEWSRALGFDAIIRGHGLLDAQQLKKSIRKNIPNMTFLEAFELTQRIINVSISPADPHQFPRLLNFLTAPTAYVGRAVLASAAIPGIFPPVQLNAKNFEGKSVPYMPKSLWIDGSVHGDIPKERINRLHNVNHYIVSQTNPHVVPFITSEKENKGLLPFVKQVITSGPVVYLEHILELARRHFDISLLGKVVNKAHAIATQTYSGDVTIYPDRNLSDLLKLFANPNDEQIQQYILDGQRSLWPRLERIRNTTLISTTFDSCLQKLRARHKYVRRPQRHGRTEIGAKRSA